MYVNAFSLLPTSVWLPVTSYVAPSPSAKPSPPSVTLLFVRALPSYSLLSVADVRLTLLLLMVSFPSTGVTLPFVSYGGTAQLFLLIAYGLILCVSRSGTSPAPKKGSVTIE